MPPSARRSPRAFSLWTLAIGSFLACDDGDDADGVPPPPAAAVEVTAVALLAPLDAQRELDPTDVRLSWETDAPDDTSAVTVHLAHDSAFVRGARAYRVAGASSLTLPAPLERSAVYYWRVSAAGPAGDSVRSPVQTFRTVLDALPADATAAAYYVAPDGYDVPGAGTRADPFGTLGYASRRVAPGDGDTIRVLPGVYRETEAIHLGLRTHLIGAGREAVRVVSGGGDVERGRERDLPDDHLFPEGTLLQLVSPAYSSPRRTSGTPRPPERGGQLVTGLTLSGEDAPLKCGFWVQNRTDVTIRDLGVVGTEERGGVVAAVPKAWFRPPAHYLTGIVLEDLTFENCGSDRADQSLGNLNLAQLDGARVRDITIADDEGYGIKFIYDGYFRGLRLSDCHIRLNEDDELWGEDIAIELWNLGPDNEVSDVDANTWLSLVNHPDVFGQPDGYENLRVHDVYVVDLDGRSSKEAIEIGVPGTDLYDLYVENKGFGIAIWDMGRSDIRVRNSIFYNSRPQESWSGAPGVYIDNSRAWPFRDIQVVNNVFDGVSTGVRAILADGGASVGEVLVANNAFFNVPNADLEASGGASMTASHNYKFSAGDAAWQIVGDVDDAALQLGDPGYRYSGERRDSYYAPVPGAPAVDAGLDVGLPFTGAAPDIGFAELE